MQITERVSAKIQDGCVVFALRDDSGRERAIWIAKDHFNKIKQLLDSVVCSRCRKGIEGSHSDDSSSGFTAGYYDCRSGSWAEFSGVDEDFLCDTCMFKDPKFIAIYGKVGESTI